MSGGASVDRRSTRNTSEPIYWIVNESNQALLTRDKIGLGRSIKKKKITIVVKLSLIHII